MGRLSGAVLWLVFAFAVGAGVLALLGVDVSPRDRPTRDEDVAYRLGYQYGIFAVVWFVGVVLTAPLGIVWLRRRARRGLV